MTALTPNDRFISLSPAAGTTVLAYDFELMIAAGMAVTLIRAGVSTPLTLGVDFSFPSGIGDASGGTLTLAVPSMAADRYLLVGMQPEQRLSDFLASQKFAALKMNADLDALTIIAQEHRRDIGRSVKAAYGTAGADLPVAEADKLLGWNTAGTALENKTAADLGAVLVVDEDDMASNSAAKVPSQQSVNVAKLQKVASRTALKSLSGTTNPLVYLYEAGREGEWEWDVTVPVATHQADTYEQRYIAPNAAADGAWVRGGAVQTGGRFTNDLPFPRIHRLADRVMVGDAVAYDGTHGGVTGSWLYDDTGGTATRAYMEGSSQLASVSSAGLALTGAARGGPGKGASIGVLAFGMSYGDGGDYDNAFGIYCEGVRGNPNASAWGQEINITNLSVSPAGLLPYTPFGAINGAPNGLGTTMGLTIMSGGDPAINPVTYDADVALVIGSNGAKFLTGIVINNNALYKTAGKAHAISLGRGHMTRWYEDTTNTIAFSFGSIISASTFATELLADDSGLALKNAAGKELFRTQFVASAVNGIALTPAAAGGNVGISATGDSTDVGMSISAKGASSVFLRNANGIGAEITAPASGIDWITLIGGSASAAATLTMAGASAGPNFIIKAKGTGSVFFQGGSAATQLQINQTGIGFYGTTPVAAKTGWGVPTGALLRTTYAAYAGQTHTTSYVQATIQALDDATKAVSQRLAALITDLHQTAGYGLLRT